MVLYNNGDWHRVGSLQKHPIPKCGALLPVRDILHPQPRSFHASTWHIDLAVCSVSADLERHDPRPDQFTLPSYDAHGVCDVDRDVGIYMCAALGEVDHDGWLGIVDR